MGQEDEETISLFRLKVQGLVNKLFGTINRYKLSLANRGPKNADRIINNINDSLKEFKTSIRSHDFGKALDILIFIKGQLETLRKVYRIDTREAQSLILTLEKEWSTLKKMFGKYPKSEWLV